MYRFSSKECHVKSGLYYYLYRFYYSILQRWLSRDPIEDVGFDWPLTGQVAQSDRDGQGESCPFRRVGLKKVLEQAAGGVRPSDTPNSYAFVKNSPVNLIDYLGLWCGSDNPTDIGSDGHVPDHPFGFDFSTACKNHDHCYGTCRADKDTCDNNFLKDMKTACSNSGVANPAFCNLLADIYYTAVHRGGRGAFDEGQKKACGLEPKCPKVDLGAIFGR